jgi:acyl-CoA reductase-like NAD-dependent aldehyde dehydrogenase
VLVPTSQVPRIIADPRIRGVTLAGSEPAGSAVAALAGRELEKTVLELGGSDPFVVLEEADLAPVAAVTRAKDEDDATRLANDSSFGLGASIWTGDPRRAARLVARIEAGSVFVNGLVKSDPRLPFGGVKRSGYGRELFEYGLRAFVTVKTVWIA